MPGSGILAGTGQQIPLPDASVDAVFYEAEVVVVQGGKDVDLGNVVEAKTLQ